jgi:hypothetical protein
MVKEPAEQDEPMAAEIATERKRRKQEESAAGIPERTSEIKKSSG